MWDHAVGVDFVWTCLRVGGVWPFLGGRDCYVVAKNGAQIVEGAFFVGDRDQLPVAVSGGDFDSEDRGGLSIGLSRRGGQVGDHTGNQHEKQSVSYGPSSKGRHLAPRNLARIRVQNRRHHKLFRITAAGHHYGSDRNPARVSLESLRLLPGRDMAALVDVAENRSGCGSSSRSSSWGSGRAPGGAVGLTGEDRDGTRNRDPCRPRRARRRCVERSEWRRRRFRALIRGRRKEHASRLASRAVPT
jgi:hypothetical protein